MSIGKVGRVRPCVNNIGHALGRDNVGCDDNAH